MEFAPVKASLYPFDFQVDNGGSPEKMTTPERQKVFPLSSFFPVLNSKCSILGNFAPVTALLVFQVDNGGLPEKLSIPERQKVFPLSSFFPVMNRNGSVLGNSRQ